MLLRHASLVSINEMRPETVLKVREVEPSTTLESDTDNDLDLFPDPSDFLPSSSPTFSFPPLPPTPPELDETETITSSTIIKTAIEVLPTKLEAKKKEIKSSLKNKDQDSNKEKSALKDQRKDMRTSL